MALPFRKRDTGAGETFKNDLKVSLPETMSFGKYKNGDLIPAKGKTPADVIIDSITDVIHPNLTSFSVSASAGSDVEVGTPDKIITVNFNRGQIQGKLIDGIWNAQVLQGNVLGAAERFFINNINNNLSNSLKINKSTVLGANSIPVKVEYKEGDEALSSDGSIFRAAKPSGALISSATWNGFYYRSAIAGNEAPTAADVRNTTYRRSSPGSFILNINTSAKRFDVFLPPGKKLLEVLDEGNLNLNITPDFKKAGTFLGKDAGNNDVLYEHYIKLIDNPYKISTTFKITTE